MSHYLLFRVIVARECSGRVDKDILFLPKKLFPMFWDGRRTSLIFIKQIKTGTVHSEGIIESIIQILYNEFGSGIILAKQCSIEKTPICNHSEFGCSSSRKLE